MRSMSQRSALSAVLAALLLTAAACADDDPVVDDTEGGAEDASDDDADVAATGAGELYDGETISVVTPFPAGGSADLLARAVAQALPASLDADVSTEVEEITGGGGAAGMLDLIERREGDGNSMIVVPMGMRFRWLLGEEGHDYALDELPAMGSMTSTLVTVGREESAPDLETVIEGEGLQWAANAPSASGGIKGALSVELLNPDGIEMVYGFDAEAEQAVSMERGEVDLATPSTASWFASFEPIDGVVPLFQTGVVGADGDVERAEDLPDIPHLGEAYEEATGDELAGDEFEAYELLLSAVTTGFVVYMHPDTPQEHLDVLGPAFDDMYESDEWAQATEDIVGLFQPGVGPEQTERVLEDFYAADDRTIEIIRELQQ